MMFSMSIALSFLFGSCWLFVEMVNDITHDLAHFEGNETIDWNKPSMKLHFMNSIQLYSDVKQLSRQVARKLKDQGFGGAVFS